MVVRELLQVILSIESTALEIGRLLLPACNPIFLRMRHDQLPSAGSCLTNAGKRLGFHFVTGRNGASH